MYQQNIIKNEGIDSAVYPNASGQSVAEPHVNYQDNYQETPQAAGETPVIKSEDDSAANNGVLSTHQKQGIRELIERTGYSLTVGPTLRKYGGPPPDGSDRPRGSEIFLGRVPRDMFEDELVPIMETYGPIWEMRILLEEKGETGRGFVFVTFASAKAATEAIKNLNQMPIPNRPGQKFVASMSKPHSLVVIRNLPKDKTRKQLEEDFGSFFDGILSVVVWGVDAETKPARLTAFLEFGSERAAVGALNKIGSGEVMDSDFGKVRPYNYQLDAYYSYIDENNNAHTVVLHVRNLPEKASEENLAAYFKMYPSFEKARLIGRFAFLHFRDHVTAEKCLQEQYGQVFMGNPLELAWAKTKTYVPTPPQPEFVEGDRTGGPRGPPPPPPDRGGRMRRPAYGPPGGDYDRRGPPPGRYSPPRGPPGRYGREDYGPPPREPYGGGSMLRPAYMDRGREDYGRPDPYGPPPGYGGQRGYEPYSRRTPPPQYGGRRPYEEDRNAGPPPRKRRPQPAGGAQQATTTSSGYPQSQTSSYPQSQTSGGYPQSQTSGYPQNQTSAYSQNQATGGYPPQNQPYPAQPQAQAYPPSSQAQYTAQYNQAYQPQQTQSYDQGNQYQQAAYQQAPQQQQQQQYTYGTTSNGSAAVRQDYATDPFAGGWGQQ